MQVNLVQNTPVLSQSTSTTKPEPAQATQAQPGLSKDNKDIGSLKRGIVPTLKGAGVGLVGGAVGGAGASALLNAPTLLKGGELAGWAMLGVMISGAVGAAAGTVVGGVTANASDNKMTSTLVGGAAGAVAGAAYGMVQGGTGGIIWGAVTGAGAGAASAFAGSLVANRQ